MVHLPPDPHILSSFANANLPWWKALAELVDNSLDAGAARVVIDISNRILTVSDDGHGCEDITAVFKLGDHKRRKSAKRSLGRYGIGAKDAWLSCADTMEVTSYRKHVATSMRVNYTEWMQNNWNVPDPVSNGLATRLFAVAKKALVYLSRQPLGLVGRSKDRCTVVSGEVERNPYRVPSPHLCPHPYRTMSGE